MGHLLYGRPPEKIEIDDRTLAHVRVVMLAKLRRNEAFAFNYERDIGAGGGWATIWVHPTIPIQFEFLGSRAPSLNRAWLDALIVSANSVDGMRLVEEPSITPEEVATGSK